MGASPIMTADAGATTGSGRPAAGAGRVIPSEFLFPRAPGLPSPERFSGFDSMTPEVPLPIQRR